MELIESSMLVIGLFYIVRVVFSLLASLQTVFANRTTKNYSRGSWALVTGSTDGVGQGFAIVLAKQGFNIIQVSRNPEKLELTGNDLKSKYGIQVKNIAKDFSSCAKAPSEFFLDIYQQTQGLDISIIINNIGTSYSNTSFVDVPLQKLLDVMVLNLFPLVYLTKLFIPKMKERNERAGIINLSSVLGNVKYERYSGYCACKAFVKCFSQVVSIEVEKNIDCMCLQPGYVLTPLTAGTKGKFLVLDRIDCAESALKVLGNSSCTHGHPRHVIAGFIYNSINYKTFMLIKRLNS